MARINQDVPGTICVNGREGVNVFPTATRNEVSADSLQFNTVCLRHTNTWPARTTDPHEDLCPEHLSVDLAVPGKNGGE